VAKTQRNPLPELPLSGAFYDALGEVGVRSGYRLDDRGALSQAVAQLSELYTRDRAELAQGTLGSSSPLARLGFFLPRDLVKMFGPLGELSRAGRLPTGRVLRVLDLGAGLGATSLGLARGLRHYGSQVERLQVSAVERDPIAVKLMSALCQAVSRLPQEFVPIALEPSGADLLGRLPTGNFDFILLGFVINELFLGQPPEQRPPLRAQLLEKLYAQLTPEGALIALEPALKESARELMHTRDALLGAATAPHIFAPCTHREPCPMLARERDWCHESLDYALPAPLAAVAKQAGLRYEGLSYAALVLTKQARFADALPRKRIVSDPLRSKGKLELFGCSRDGYQRLLRLDRALSKENAGYDALRRGDVLELAGTRVARTTPIKRR
jgi:ribosomal protein RSM22 (predicted rRNA methylase)